MVQTTVQISTELLDQLKSMKMTDKETYEEIIWDLIEDHFELSEETKKNIAQSEKEIIEGKTIKFEDIKKRLKI